MLVGPFRQTGVGGDGKSWSPIAQISNVSVSKVNGQC